MNAWDGIEALLRMRLPFGGLERTLRVATWGIRFRGLDADVAGALDERWGAYVSERVPHGLDDVRAVHLADAGDRRWLPPPEPGERYRVEARIESGVPVLRSYHLLAGPDAHGHGWRALVTRCDDEPVGRTVENLARLLLGRMVVRNGGVPFHGAGVLRGDGAHLLVGPSGAGKTTAVALSRPCPSLGDDFALAVPRPEGWRTATVPFDNREAVEGPADGRWLPLAGIWRLFKSEDVRLETPPALTRDLSILAGAAAPWAMPDLAETLVDNVARLSREVRYGHLHFRLAPDFWERIGPD